MGKVRNMAIPTIKIADFPTLITGILSLRTPLINPPKIAPIPKNIRNTPA